MRLTIVNLTRTISAADFGKVVSAIDRQVAEDFAPIWEIPAKLRVHNPPPQGRRAKIEGLHDAVIYVGDSSQDPDSGVDAYGVHSTNEANIPYGFVYLDICEGREELWTATLSHEVLELLADPAAVLAVAGPHPRYRTKAAHYDLEVCDPVQGDTYVIDDVTVSNFVTPSWFGMTGDPKFTNFLKLPLKPFAVRAGGYCQYTDKRGSHSVYGKKVLARLGTRQAMNRLLKDCRRNTRRAAQALG